MTMIPLAAVMLRLLLAWSPAWGQSLEEWASRSASEGAAESFFLPRIENGEAVGQEAKARELLAFLIRDYKSRGKKSAMASISYLASISLADPTAATTSVGRFQRRKRPPASYVIASGAGADKATEALVAVLWESSQGAGHAVMTLRWADGGWKLFRSLRSSPTPLKAKLVR